MGADLIYSINRMEVKKDQALLNVKHLSLPERAENTARFLQDFCGISRWWHEDSIDPKDVHEFLAQCVEDVYDTPNRRDCGFFDIEGTTYYMTAGMSWGDTPTEAYDSFVVCESLGLTLNQPKLDVSA